MLRTLDRYLLQELGLAVAATAMVLLVVTAGGTFADVLNKVALGRLPGNVMFEVLGLRMVDALPVLLPLALFLGVMMGLGRLYRDSEMHVLSACGIGPRQLLRPMAWLALPLALLVAVLSLGLAPLAVRASQALIEQANRSVIAAGLEPGRFVELPGRGGIIFVEDMNPAGTRLQHVFVETEREAGNKNTKKPAAPRIDLITAATGELYHESNGQGRFLALNDGHRYEGGLDSDDWRLMRFARNEVALSEPDPDAEDTSDPEHAQRSLVLAHSSSAAASAELAWRVAAPVILLVLALLALPLARQTPREPRYGRLLIAILAYLVYANVLALMRLGIAQGRLPGWGALWGVHLLVALIAAWLFWRPYAVRRRRVRS